MGKKAPKRVPMSDYSPIDSRLSQAVEEIIRNVGEDPTREGLVRTPYRFIKMLSHLTSGYKQSIEKVVNGAIYKESYSEMVVVRNVEIYSLCEHHLLPFFGKCHVAYIPRGKIIGLSKIPRIIDVYARRFQVQERLTSQISDCLMHFLEPQGVGVVIEAYHLCMMMRGIEKQSAFAKTSSLLGDFNKAPTRSEFFDLIR